MDILLHSIFERNKSSLAIFQDKFLAESFIQEIFNILYLNTRFQYPTKTDLRIKYEELKDSFVRILSTHQHNSTEHSNVSELFFENLPKIYAQTIKDAQAIYEMDPAAHSIDEVLHAYPGFYAIAVYRIAHYLWEQGLTTISRLFSELAHSKTGIDIHPGAHIGDNFGIDHGTGIVIGETANIGNNVKLYQGVTLGALQVAKEFASKKRHPTIEDNVVIYANATILGGETIIGRDSLIGGNVWITKSILPNSVVYHKSEIKVKDKTPFEEPINFSI